MSEDRHRLGYWLHLGVRDYANTLGLQQELVALRQQGRIPDTILAVEHTPTLTLGRASRPEHILAAPATLAKAGVEVHSSDRGGDVTYHGPGQLVFYAVCDLRERGRDVHGHARRLEEVMIRTAAALGVPAWREAGYPGIWAAGGKLGALGVSVRRWVTSHGAALNVSTDLEHFSFIVPCGLHDAPTTSLERELGRRVRMRAARDALRETCQEVFGLHLLDSRLDDFSRAAMLSPCGVAG